MAAAAPFLGIEDALAAPQAAPKAPRLVIRRSKDRGTADHGWLKAKFSFSFSRYRDPRHMGFRQLRVINEDVIAGGGGFPMHPHKDMEIVTYVLSGALEHKDSLKNGGIIRPGLVQHMSAGTGIYHSEFNPSKVDSTHLLQIWMLPSKRRIKPGYGQKHFPVAERQNRMRLVASPTGASNSVKIATNVNMYASVLKPKQKVTHVVPHRRHAWLQVARGSIDVNGTKLFQGDGARTSDAGKLVITGRENAEFLLFDLA
ncbi:MAG: pirin family protein [Planctomycetota bacterium]|nr:pirin family protein [Planctomycetota bacterium]